MEQIELNKKLWDFLMGESDRKTEEEIKAWLDESVENQTYYEDFQRNYLRMRWSMRRKLIVHDQFAGIRDKIRTRMFWRRMQWAASVIVLLGVGVVFWMLRSDIRETEMQLVQSEEIRPGKSQAVLVLSEGTEVPLVALNTELEEKDGTRIKVDDRGEVRYQTGEKETATEHIVYNKLVIPRGGEFLMVLADGTKVWLNAATELKYPTHFSGKERVVYLTGEAYFDVQPDPGHPFIVKAGQVDIRVFGTEFNVNNYSREKVQTVLVEGKVAVRSKDSEVCIAPGDKAEYKEGNPAIQVEPVDVAPYVAWKYGNFIFQNEPLDRIMEKLSLWYDIDFFFVSEELKEVCLSGDMKRYEEIGDLLYYFEKSSGLKFKIQDRTVIIDK